MKLIEGWKQSYLYWSVRVQIVCIAIAGWFVFDPGAILWVWKSMPPPIRAILPDTVEHSVSAVLFVLSLIAAMARVVKQPKANAKIEAKLAAKKAQNNVAV